VMLVGFAEGLGAAKTYAARAHYDIDVDRELIGLGSANLGAGLCSGMVVNGSLSKTAVNGGAGARTQLSSVSVAALTVVTLLFLTGLFEDLPEATLAAVVIAAVIELVDVPALVHLFHVFIGPSGRRLNPAIRPDFVAAVAALLGVTLFDTLPGLFIGIAVSLLLVLYRASSPHVAVLGRTSGPDGQFADLERHEGNRPVPGIVILRPEGGLFFANAEHVRQAVRTRVADTHPVAVIIDAETVPYIDVTAASMLHELADELARADVRLLLARDIGAVRDVLARSGEGSALEMHGRVRDAVEAVAASRV
jgi:sulfate permease, SulP family